MRRLPSITRRVSWTSSVDVRGILRRDAQRRVMQNIRGGVAAVLMAAAIAGCTTTTSSAPPGTTGAGDAGAATSSDTSGLTCLAVLQCAVACADQPCADACFARGDADAQTKASAFGDCLTQNNCSDRSCLDANCSDSFNACIARPTQPAGAPITGEAPQGSVPADFVGTWKYTSTFGTSDNFTFNADGTASRKQLSIGSFSGCTTTTAFEDEGTVVFDSAGGFKFFITKSTTTSSQCGASSSMPGTTGAFDFTTEAIPALGPGKYWFFWVQGCPVTSEADKRVQCGHEFDL